MPVYYPPIVSVATGEESQLILGQRIFAERAIDFSLLKTTAMQTWLGLTTTGSTPDDADTILATQIFGP